MNKFKRAAEKKKKPAGETKQGMHFKPYPMLGEITPLSGLEDETSTLVIQQEEYIVEFEPGQQQPSFKLAFALTASISDADSAKSIMRLKDAEGVQRGYAIKINKGNQEIPVNSLHILHIENNVYKVYTALLDNEFLCQVWLDKEKRIPMIRMLHVQSIREIEIDVASTIQAYLMGRFSYNGRLYGLFTSFAPPPARVPAPARQIEARVSTRQVQEPASLTKGKPRSQSRPSGTELRARLEAEEEEEEPRIMEIESSRSRSRRRRRELEEEEEEEEEPRIMEIESSRSRSRRRRRELEEEEEEEPRIMEIESSRSRNRQGEGGGGGGRRRRRQPAEEEEEPRIMEIESSRTQRLVPTLDPEAEYEEWKQRSPEELVEKLEDVWYAYGFHCNVTKLNIHVHIQKKSNISIQKTAFRLRLKSRYYNPGGSWDQLVLTDGSQGTPFSRITPNSRQKSWDLNLTRAKILPNVPIGTFEVSLGDERKTFAVMPKDYTESVDLTMSMKDKYTVSVTFNFSKPEMLELSAPHPINQAQAEARLLQMSSMEFMARFSPDTELDDTTLEWKAKADREDKQLFGAYDRIRISSVKRANANLRLLAELRHENIAHILAMGVEKDQDQNEYIWVATGHSVNNYKRLVGDHTTGKLLDNPINKDASQSWQVLWQMCSLLSYLERHGITTCHEVDGALVNSLLYHQKTFHIVYTDPIHLYRERNEEDAKRDRVQFAFAILFIIDRDLARHFMSAATGTYVKSEVDQVIDAYKKKKKKLPVDMNLMMEDVLDVVVQLTGQREKVFDFEAFLRARIKIFMAPMIHYPHNLEREMIPMVCPTAKTLLDRLIVTILYLKLPCKPLLVDINPEKTTDMCTTHFLDFLRSFSNTPNIDHFHDFVLRHLVKLYAIDGTMLKHAKKNLSFIQKQLKRWKEPIGHYHLTSYECFSLYHLYKYVLLSIGVMKPEIRISALEFQNQMKRTLFDQTVREWYEQRVLQPRFDLRHFMTTFFTYSHHDAMVAFDLISVSDANDQRVVNRQCLQGLLEQSEIEFLFREMNVVAPATITRERWAACAIPMGMRELVTSVRHDFARHESVPDVLHGPIKRDLDELSELSDQDNDGDGNDDGDGDGDGDGDTHIRYSEDHQTQHGTVNRVLDLFFEGPPRELVTDGSFARSTSRKIAATSLASRIIDAPDHETELDKHGDKVVRAYANDLMDSYNYDPLIIINDDLGNLPRFEYNRQGDVIVTAGLENDHHHRHHHRVSELSVTGTEILDEERGLPNET